MALKRSCIEIPQALKPKIKNNKDEVECVFIFGNGIRQSQELNALAKVPSSIAPIMEDFFTGNSRLSREENYITRRVIKDFFISQNDRARTSACDDYIPSAAPSAASVDGIEESKGLGHRSAK